MKILFLGGTWSVIKNEDGTCGKPSSLVNKISDALCNYMGDNEIDIYNGGNYNDLDKILTSCPRYDIVFWWANVENNNLPKIRDVKEVAPHVMLVTSKRNDNDKYNFMQLTQHALALKANLTFEFKKVGDKFSIRVYDPLGCEWYNGFDVKQSVFNAMDRLEYLRSITRQKTVKSDMSNGLVLSWYFDQFKQKEVQSNKMISIPYEQRFVDVVKKYSEDFYRIMKPGENITRFLGNASLKPNMPPQVGRCSKGMPSFKHDGFVFVSQRNIDKKHIELNNFVPCYMENGELYYCGDNKPSVDAPIQLRLYEQLPNIKYIIHSHCYIKDAPFTSKSIPCGAIEEVEEVMDVIHKNYKSNKNNFYVINLKGHGSILMAGNIDLLDGIEYYGREMPEKMF